MSTTEHTPRECVKTFLDQALRELDIEPELAYLLETPHRTVEVELPLRLDNGELAVYSGFRVQHDNSRGPFKGGLRFHPQLDADHSQGLASLMTWKTALMNIPMGGAKGGINCDPSELSVAEVERLTKMFITRIEALIGPDRDIPAPDVATGGREMAWIYDAYTQIHGHHPDVVTGKPLELGGSHGRVEATGFGVAFSAERACGARDIDMDGARIAIQGFGKVGTYAAQFLSEKGAKIVAVSDVGGGLFNEDGLDVAALIEQTRDEDGSTKSVTETSNLGKEISNEALLTLDVSVLIPAALGAAINSDNVHDISADIVVEAANLPVTCDADDVLKERGIAVIPDILANAGGVVVSYLEWVQNRQGRQWTEEIVREAQIEYLEAAWTTLESRMADNNINFRLAAYTVAAERVIKTKNLRGYLL
jgi:glutamate dehydrogenase (NAD(P)+)